MGGGEQADVRVSDAERNAVVERLRTSCAEGFLTLDEFSDRVGSALASRTRGELAAVTADLPVPAPATGGAPARPRPTPTTSVVGILGGAQRKGRWRVGEQVTAVAMLGGCELDLRHAEIDCPRVEIVAVAFMGGIEIVVPEGIPVVLEGVAIMGGKHMRVKDVDPLPGAPQIVVKAFALMGGIQVRTKRSREPGGRVVAAHVHMPVPDAPGPVARTASLPVRRAPEPRLVDEPPKHLPDDLTGTVTLLFTDIEDFTGLTARLGDADAQDVLRDHHALLSAQAEVCGGHVVKTQGDGAMIAFRSASAALRCSIATQRAVAEWNDAHPATPLLVRMGLHTGEALRDGDDFGGRAVILAARIAGVSGGGEVLVSRVLHDLTAGTGEFRFGEARTVELKGFDEAQVVFPVVW